MAQDHGAGAVRQPPSVSMATFRAQVGAPPSTIQSAPARLQLHHLDGATEYSSPEVIPRSFYAPTDRNIAGSQGGTATDFPPETIRWVIAAVTPRNPSQATDKWVQSNESTRYARVNTPPEVHDNADICKCCRVARAVRSLDELMAGDHSRTPPADDEKGHYFAGLPQPGLAQYRAPLS